MTGKISASPLLFFVGADNFCTMVPSTSRSVSAQGDYDCEPDLPGDAPEGKKEEVVKVEAVPPATTYFAHLKQ